MVRMKSLGRWFESGSKEIFFFSNDFFFVWKIALNFSLLTYTLHFSTFYYFFGALFIEPNTFIKIIIHGIVNILDKYVWMECRL